MDKKVTPNLLKMEKKMVFCQFRQVFEQTNWITQINTPGN